MPYMIGSAVFGTGLAVRGPSSNWSRSDQNHVARALLDGDGLPKLGRDRDRPQEKNRLPSLGNLSVALGPSAFKEEVAADEARKAKRTHGAREPRRSAACEPLVGALLTIRTGPTLTSGYRVTFTVSLRPWNDGTNSTTAPIAEVGPMRCKPMQCAQITDSLSTTLLLQ